MKKKLSSNDHSSITNRSEHRQKSDSTLARSCPMVIMWAALVICLRTESLNNINVCINQKNKSLN